MTYAAIGADAVDGLIAANCVPASGSVFAPGRTTVTCSAQDAHGNTSASASFRVLVHFGSTGLFSPLSADTTAVLDERTIVPVRFQLTDASAGITDLTARLFIAPVDAKGALGPQQPAPGLSNKNGRAVHGNVFAFVSGAYVLLTPLKGLAQGNWAFIVDLGDGCHEGDPVHRLLAPPALARRRRLDARSDRFRRLARGWRASRVAPDWLAPSTAASSSSACPGRFPDSARAGKDDEGGQREADAVPSRRSATRSSRRSPTA